MIMASMFSKLDEYGFERPEDFNYASYEQFMEEYLVVLTRRSMKWENLLSSKKNQMPRSRTLKRYTRKGIPYKHRALIWMSISGADAMKEKQPELYRKRLLGPLQETIVDAIKVDVPRTFPDNIHFTDAADGQLWHLQNVLIAYAHENISIGYCQGLNYIAALLLLVTKSEEDSFWLLKVLVEKILPDSYYGGDLIGVKTDMAVLAELVKMKCPDIHDIIESTGVTWPVVIAKWFVCIYADVLPTETVFRIWDCMFYEGPKIIFRVAMSLVLENKESILSCQDLSEIIQCFKSIPKRTTVVDCHSFMKSIFVVPGTLPISKLRKLQEKCTDEIRQEEIKLQAKLKRF